MDPRSLALHLLLWCPACASHHAEALPPPAATAVPGVPQARRLRLRTSSEGRDSTLSVDLSDGMGPDEAAVLAVLLNPELVAVRDEHGAAEAQLMAAGILPNPVVGVEYAHPYGSGSSGTNGALNLSLSWDLKPLFARAARRAAAEASRAEVDLGIAWHEWQVAQQARLLVVRLGWLRERIDLARGEEELEARTAEALERSSTAGDATLGQVGVQRAALEAARGQVQELEQLGLEAESDLLALLGNPPWKRLEVPKVEPAPEIQPPDPSTCLSRRLDLQALERGYQARDASLRAAVLDQFPAVSIGISHQRDESALSFVGAFVSVGLPVFDRNQGQIALEEASQQRLRHEYDSRIAQVRAELQHLERFSRLLRDQLPRVRAGIEALEAIEREEKSALDRGDLSQASYQTVRSALLEQRLRHAGLSQALAEALAGLQAACGAGPASGEK